MTQMLAVLFLPQRCFSHSTYSLSFRLAKFYRSVLKFSGSNFYHIHSIPEPIQSVFKSIFQFYNFHLIFWFNFSFLRLCTFSFVVRELVIALSILLMAALLSLSDNSNILFISVLVSVDHLFSFKL